MRSSASSLGAAVGTGVDRDAAATPRRQDRLLDPIDRRSLRGPGEWGARRSYRVAVADVHDGSPLAPPVRVDAKRELGVCKVFLGALRHPACSFVGAISLSTAAQHQM